MDNDIQMVPLPEAERARFRCNLQRSFVEAVKDDYAGDGSKLISDGEIDASIDALGAESYWFELGDARVGGCVLSIDADTNRNVIELLFIDPSTHNKGLGYCAMQAIWSSHPETRIWELETPTFEKRNIHFYVNKCGYHIVEYYNERNPDPHRPSVCDRDAAHGNHGERPDEMFRFEKVMP